MPPSPDLTIVVVTYNSADVIAGCLDAIGPATRGLDVEVIVADNDSADATTELVRSHPLGVRLLSTGRNAGYAAAINAATEVAEPDTDVLILNPDIRLAPDGVAVLRAALYNSHAGIAAPRLTDEAGHLQFSQRRDPTIVRALGEALVGGTRAGRHQLFGEVVTDPARYEHDAFVDWATGAALLVSAECRAAVGEWDESFFLYSEETDYCQRARRAGFAVRYVAAAHAVHLGGDLETSPALRRHLVRNKRTLYQRQHTTPATAGYGAALLLNEGLRAARGSATHRAGLRELLTRTPAKPAPAETVGTVGSARPHEPAGRERGFVVFSAQDYWYHNRAHSDVALARALSRTGPVLLVNSLGLRMPTRANTTQPLRRIGRKLRSTARTLRRPETGYPQLWVFSPVSLPLFGNPNARRLNAKSVALQVKVAARLARLGSKPDVLITLPTAWDVARDLNARAIIVNRSDKYSALPEADNALIESMEHQMLAACDAAVFVNHELLAEEQSLVLRGEAVYLGHGVDLEHFTVGRRAAAPTDIAEIARPRIGFFGGIDDYVVDLGLISELAKRSPQLQIVLIGAATCLMDDLTSLPNVTWLGMRDYKEIPAYGAAFDVAIMPWLRNDWIERCNPIKAKEYLALGLPIVTTRYPEAAWLEDVMDIADDTDSFIELVQTAVRTGGKSSPQQRRDRVRDDSWAGRAAVLRDLAAKAR